MIKEKKNKTLIFKLNGYRIIQNVNSIKPKKTQLYNFDISVNLSREKMWNDYNTKKRQLLKEWKEFEKYCQKYKSSYFCLNFDWIFFIDFGKPNYELENQRKGKQILSLAVCIYCKNRDYSEREGYDFCNYMLQHPFFSKIKEYSL